MTENIYERINKVLTWKRVLGFNFILFLVLVIPLSVRLSQQDTENRSNAASEDVIATSPTPLPNYPKISPTIDRVNTFYGKAGDTIVIVGNNFGDYQWASKVFVGNVEATKKEIVRWSNSILEVQIPEGARTGKVWVAVNGQEAKWEGSLLLYDVARAAKVGLKPSSATQASVVLEKADGAVSGMVEIAYVSEPLNIIPSSFVTINSSTPLVDVLGKKMRVAFAVNGVLPRSSVEVMAIEHPQVGTIEIVRTELFDSNGNLIEVFSDPLSVKLFAQ